MPPRENCLLIAAMVQDLGFHVGEWLGRLQFPPCRGGLMIPAPKPLFCCKYICSFDFGFGFSNPPLVLRFQYVCNPTRITPTSCSAGVFPSFDPISVPQNTDKFEAIGSPLSTAAVDWEPSRLVGSGTSVMRDAVFDTFGEAAMKLQTKLLSLLESMDFQNHKSMVEEATTVFNALDRLEMINI